MHALPLQISFKPHGEPHAPQSSMLEVRSAQVPPQLDCPGGQLEAHAPFAQTCPALHGAPHAPQLATLVRCVSHPLEGSASQSPNPAAQAPIAQAPAGQVGVACAS
jgi:hypothetical protein